MGARRDEPNTRRGERQVKTRLRKIGWVAAAIVLAAVSLDRLTAPGLRPGYSGPRERDPELTEYYGYPRHPIRGTVEESGGTSRYVLRRVTFPCALDLAGQDKPVRIDYYEQKAEGRFPTILMLPIAGGVDFSIESTSRYLASHGFNCAIVHRRNFGRDSFKRGPDFEDFLKHSVLENRQALDYLTQQEKVDESRLGCLGISLGGLEACVTAAVDERLKSTVIILAGGSVADVLCSSRDRMLRKPVERVLTERGITLQEFHDEFSRDVRTDPVRLAPYVDARTTLMYIALFDGTVPRICGNALRQAMGGPRATYMLTGHYSAILYLPHMKRKALSFFRRTLAARE